MSARFFFYGTLLGGGTTGAARAALRLLEDLGEATVPGRLIAIPDPRGWYPGLIAGPGMVRGRLFAEIGPGATALLDSYEGFDPAQPDRGDYRREAIAATAAGGAVVLAQTYRWIARHPAGAEAIADGDFRAWLGRCGRKPLGG